MPRACTICTHAQQTTIDQALDAYTPYRQVAERYRVSKSALLRHQEHRAPETDSVPDHGPDHALVPLHDCPCRRIPWATLAQEGHQLDDYLRTAHDPYRALGIVKHVVVLLVKFVDGAVQDPATIPAAVPVPVPQAPTRRRYGSSLLGHRS